MEIATYIGMSITEFWEITPFELSFAVKGYAKNKENAAKESIYQAYLISRWVWQKKINIEKILDFEKKKKTMTDNEMLEKVKALNALFGGKTRNG